MKVIGLYILLLFPLVAMGQKKYTLFFINNDYKVIKKHPETSFKDSTTLKNYIRDFQNFAYKRGFLLASFDSILKKDEKQYSVYFTSGEKFQYASLQLAPEELKFLRKKTSLTEKIILKTPLNPTEYQQVMLTIQQAYLNNGYPFVSVRLDSVVFEKNKLRAQLKIEKGPQLKWSKLHVKGDSTISKKFVGSLIGVKPKMLYNENGFFQITKRLKQINFFEELKPAEMMFTKEGSELFLYLKSKPMSSVNGIIGLQPNATTGKLALTGELTLKLQNILKRGELLFIDWRSIQAQTQALKTKLNYPFLFNTNFGVEGTFDLYKRDTTFMELTGTAGVNYYLNGGSYFKAFYQNNSSNLLSGATNSGIANLGSVKTNAYGIAFHWEKVDYIPSPTKGVLLETKFSAGTRSARLPDSLIAEKTTVYRASLQVTGFIPLAKRHVLALKNATHLYHAPIIYANEAHRFGGLTTQRGFNEEELLATAQTIFSLEYRFLVDKNSYAFGFFDQSWYENNSKKYYNDAPFGFGVGFSFGTKIGTFAISYALGKQFTNPIKFRDSKVHFGYIAFF